MTQSDSRRNAVALAAVCLTSLMFGLEISSVPVILPTLEHVLHGDFNGMQWIMNAYTIACTTVLMGPARSRTGSAARVYVIGTVLFGATSQLARTERAGARRGPVAAGRQRRRDADLPDCGAVAPVPRGPGARPCVRDLGIVFGIGRVRADRRRRDRRAGKLAVGVLVHAPLAAVALVLIGGAVQESRDPHAGRLDVAGIVTLSLAVLGLAFYITQSAALGLTSAAGLGVLGATVLALAGFFIAERASARPMFDFSVFRIRAFTGAIFGSMGMNFSFWPFMIYLPIWFQVALGYDSVTAGLALLAYTLPTLVAPPFGERLALRYGPGVVIPGGLFTIAAGSR